MATTQTKTLRPSGKHRTAVAPDERSRQRAKPAGVTPVVELSFAVAPFVSIIQRHVKLTKKVREAITQDLTEVLGHPQVHLLTVNDAPAPPPGPRPEADPVLTTEEAARLAGVSRPFLVKLIDSGAIELHQKVGNQRRVKRSAVLRWSTAERPRQAKSLKRLAEDLDEEIFSS